MSTFVLSMFWSPSKRTTAWPLSALATTAGCSSGLSAVAVTPGTEPLLHEASFPAASPFASSAMSHSATPVAGIGAPAGNVTPDCGVGGAELLWAVLVSTGAGGGVGSSFFLQAEMAIRQSDRTTNLFFIGGNRIESHCAAGARSGSGNEDRNRLAIDLSPSILRSPPCNASDSLPPP